MPVESATSAPPDFSNVEGNSSSTAPDACDTAAGNLGNAALDLADTARDWLTGDSSGRDVWQGIKDLGQAGKDTWDTCVPEDKFKQPMEPVLDPMLPPGY